jgi:hypothetical protein
MTGTRFAWAALATVLAATGCGGSNAHPAHPGASARSTGPPQALPVPTDMHAYLTQAVDRTIAVRPRHVSSSTTLSGTKGRHVQTVDGHMGGQPDSYEMVLVTDGLRAEARVIGSAAWLESRTPELTRAMPAGKAWLRLDAARLAASGIPTTNDQLALLYALRGGGSERDLGVEQVEGVRVRHFRAQVDLDRAVCATPTPWRSDVRQLLTPKSGATPSFVADAWVDSFQLVRRLRLSAGLGGGATAAYEVFLPGDNAAESVAPPPAQTAVALQDVPALGRAFPGTPRPAPSC